MLSPFIDRVSITFCCRLQTVALLEFIDIPDYCYSYHHYFCCCCCCAATTTTTTTTTVLLLQYYYYYYYYCCSSCCCHVCSTVDVSASKLKDCMRQFTLSRKLQVTLDPSLVHWNLPGNTTTPRDYQVSSSSSCCSSYTVSSVLVILSIHLSICLSLVR